MFNTKMVNDLPQISTQSHVCSSCATGKKIHRKPFLVATIFGATKALKLVHSNIYGPINIDSLGKN